MTHVFIESLLTGWNHNRDYANKLVADLTDEQMILQPQPDMNHPAWIFCHLNAYHPVIATILRGEKPDDPLHHPFGQKSKPQADVSLYGSKDALLNAYNEGHEQVAVALKEGGEVAMERLMPLERWQTRFPKVGSILGYIMLVHESTHLGQISAWRRMQSLPSV